MGYRTYTCPSAARCGGCEWLNVPYPIQLKRKQAALEETFRPFLEGTSAPELLPIVGMDEPLPLPLMAASATASMQRARTAS